MAKSITKEFLSGSTNGRPILVVATATPGTIIHTANLISRDEIYLWAHNRDMVSRLLTIEYGGVTSPGDIFDMAIPPNSGLEFIIPGLILSNGLIVRAFAAAANVINVCGYVERVS